VIHENRGLTDWVRSFADQVAGAGFLAIAPDLLSESSKGIHKTSDFPDSDAAREAIYQLDPEYVTAALDSVFNFVRKLPSSTREVSVAGFCWGGSQSFRYATNNTDLKRVFVFYGSAPDEEKALSRIDAPVYGFYAENDQRINAGIGETEKNMRALGKTYDYVIYPEAGHAFMRRGDDPKGDEGNKKARDAAWERFISILKLP
jgi:carboxymethylenebutenolidase